LVYLYTIYVYKLSTYCFYVDMLGRAVDKWQKNVDNLWISYPHRDEL